jgi:hypothetical protein
MTVVVDGGNGAGKKKIPLIEDSDSDVVVLSD